MTNHVDFSTAMPILVCFEYRGAVYASFPRALAMPSFRCFSIGANYEKKWVCTFSGPRANKKAVFWESLTGQRFTMHAPQPRLQQKGEPTHTISRPDDNGGFFSDVSFSVMKLFTPKSVHDLGHLMYGSFQTWLRRTAVAHLF